MPYTLSMGGAGDRATVTALLPFPTFSDFAAFIETRLSAPTVPAPLPKDQSDWIAAAALPPGRKKSHTPTSTPFLWLDYDGMPPALLPPMLLKLASIPHIMYPTSSGITPKEVNVHIVIPLPPNTPIATYSDYWDAATDLLAPAVPDRTKRSPNGVMYIPTPGAGKPTRLVSAYLPPAPTAWNPTLPPKTHSIPQQHDDPVPLTPTRRRLIERAVNSAIAMGLANDYSTWFDTMNSLRNAFPPPDDEEGYELFDHFSQSTTRTNCDPSKNRRFWDDASPIRGDGKTTRSFEALLKDIAASPHSDSFRDDVFTTLEELADSPRFSSARAWGKDPDVIDHLRTLQPDDPEIDTLAEVLRKKHHKGNGKGNSTTYKNVVKTAIKASQRLVKNSDSSDVFDALPRVFHQTYYNDGANVYYRVTPTEVLLRDVCKKPPVERLKPQGAADAWTQEMLNNPSFRKAYVDDMGVIDYKAAEAFTRTYAPRTSGITFSPSEDIFVEQNDGIYINTYRKDVVPVPLPAPAGSIYELAIEAFRRVNEHRHPDPDRPLPAGLSTDRDVLYYFLGHTLAHPERPLAWYLFNHSESGGTGKSITQDLLAAAVGYAHSYTGGADTMLTDKHNAYLLGRVLVGISEVGANADELIEKLKQYVDNANAAIRQMFTDWASEKLYVNFIINTNKLHLSTLEPGERRFALVVDKQSERERDEFNAKMKAEFLPRAQAIDPEWAMEHSSGETFIFGLILRLLEVPGHFSHFVLEQYRAIRGIDPNMGPNTLNQAAFTNCVGSALEDQLYHAIRSLERPLPWLVCPSTFFERLAIHLGLCDREEWELANFNTRANTVPVQARVATRLTKNARGFHKANTKLRPYITIPGTAHKKQYSLYTASATPAQLLEVQDPKTTGMTLSKIQERLEHEYFTEEEE